MICLSCLQINSKYSEELAQECLEWIQAIIGEPTNTSGDMDNFYEVLKDGTILCKWVSTVEEPRQRLGKLYILE